MSRLEDWVEDRREKLATFYMRLAWVCLAVMFVYPPVMVGVFSFSAASIFLRYYERRPMQGEN